MAAAMYINHIDISDNISLRLFFMNAIKRIVSPAHRSCEQRHRSCEQRHRSCEQRHRSCEQRLMYQTKKILANNN